MRQSREYICREKLMRVKINLLWEDTRNSYRRIYTQNALHKPQMWKRINNGDRKMLDEILLSKHG